MMIHNEAQLRELYGFPSGRAKDKQLAALDKHAIHFIKESPFFVLSTYGKDGSVDTSPRGGEAGFVKVLNDKQVVIPDASGNNRIDSLVNIVETGKMGTLFMIPGVDETLRMNGSASISTEANLLALFATEKRPPKSCIILEVEEMFLHCAKAFMRSKLWEEETKIDRDSFPTMGQMLKDQLGTPGEPESREDMVERYKKTL